MRLRMWNAAPIGTACVLMALLGMLSARHDAALAAGRPVLARSSAVAGRQMLAAARRGDASAQAMLGYAYATGQGVPQNVVVAVHWYRRAAMQGNATAQYLLGTMYARGQGVPVDKVRAQKWLILATARANNQQRENFRRIRDAVASSMSPRQIARAQALAYGWTRRHRR